MASISIAGRVIQAPEVKFFESGSQICRFTLVDKAWVKPEKGQDEAPGQFFDVEVWGKQAELCADRLTKGSRAAVSGQAVWREYTNKDGRKVRALSVQNPSVTFLDTKAEREALGGGGGAFGADGELPF